MVKKMDLSDQRLAQLEAVIKTYRQEFYSVGKALKEIRDGRHYHKLSFKSFESYVRIRWDMGRSHAYRLIEAFCVIDNLSPIGEELPQNEAQARPLTKLDAFSQRRLWRDFLKTGKNAERAEYQKVRIRSAGRAKYQSTLYRAHQQGLSTSCQRNAVTNQLGSK